MYIRDEGISSLSAISSQTLSNQQAISLKVLPDYRAQEVKKRVADNLEANKKGASAIDLDSQIRY